MRGPCLRLAQIGADSKHSRRLAGLPESHYPLGGQSHQAPEIHARDLDVRGRRHPAPRCHRHCERSEAIQSSLAKSSGLLRCARNDDLQCTGRARGSLRSEPSQNIHADWRVCQKVTTRSAVKAIKRPKIHARDLDVRGRRHPAPRCHRHCERSEAIQSSLAKSSGLLRCARNDDLQCAGRACGSLRSEPTQNIHADWRVCQKVTTRSAVKAIKRPKFTRALSMSTADATRLRGATVIASVAKQSSLLLQRVLDCFAALAMTIYNARAVLAARSDRSRLKTFTPIGGSARKSLPARRSKPSSARKFMRAISMSAADATRLRGATVIASVAKQSSLLLQRVLDCFAALAMTIYNAPAVLAARSDRSRLKTFTPIGGSARKSLPARRSKPSGVRNSRARSRCPRQTPPGSEVPPSLRA